MPFTNYSAIKMNEIVSFTEKYMELENMLSEINQTEKDKYHVFPHVWHLDLKKEKERIVTRLLKWGLLMGEY
jgi:hypothetical protein